MGSREHHAIASGRLGLVKGAVGSGDQGIGSFIPGLASDAPKLMVIEMLRESVSAGFAQSHAATAQRGHVARILRRLRQ